MIVGSGAAERFHLRWFEGHLPERGVAVRPIATERVGFALAGPALARAAGAADRRGLSAAAFRFFDIRPIDVATVPALVARVSFTGELGFEIYVDAAYELALYDALVEAGARPRPRALRRPRAERAAAGEELRRVAARVHPGLHAVPRPASRASSTSTRAISSAARRRCASGTSRRAIAW